MKHWDECSKEEQIARWTNVRRVLRNLTPHQKKAHWDMGHWGRKTDCGTIACAAGHCGFDPWFNEQGFKAEIISSFEEEYVILVAGSSHWTRSTVESFFGITGARRIFMNGRPRSVTAVRNEIAQYIKEIV